MLVGPQFAKEEKELRAELLGMRRAAVVGVKKTIATRYVDHGEDHRDPFESDSCYGRGDQVVACGTPFIATPGVCTYNGFWSDKDRRRCRRKREKIANS